MLKFSRNNQNIQMFGVTLPLVIIHRDFFLLGIITARHSKQLPVGLMMLSDGKVHIKIFFNKSTKTILWL